MAKVSGIGKSGVGWTRTGIKSFTWRLDGIEDVNREINARLQEIKGKTAEGYIVAANHVLNDADHGTPPLVPQKTGTLRASRFIRPLKKKGGDPYVILGYRTNYAAAVHEMLQSISGKPIDWTRKGSGPKFLEASLKRNRDVIIEIVAGYARR